MPLQFICIESADALREYAKAWDDLWWRSDIALPTKRAEMLLHWLTLSPAETSLRVVAVADGDRLLAALPLVERRFVRAVRIEGIPVNCWCSAGDLLLDSECNHGEVLGYLVDGIGQLPWPLVWCDTIEIDAPRWQAFRLALSETRLPAESTWQFELGLIDIDRDWEAYERRWSKNHRKQMRRCLRRAREQGELELCVHRDLPPDALDSLLFEGLEVEDRSWKGPAGSSVLRTPGGIEFYRKQAELLAGWGSLNSFF